ncbi:hypothetical protein VCRA2116O30_30070 [Vibrio crassostreae]|nr:hypothetical protein VCRA2119O45_20227 [Vibrio crassostreae]CAK2057125.1 hypothetical protein VCRA2116O26_30111 [Vibrio crassostreae]CAK2057923.1 hypothetical protein VCRA2116O31_30109 [Vibrio crassostreae]CAK2069595.1 hypothetical protein VCRA2116O30_30070 [Vibrio crassostreae]CAK2071401.1 hypothetical protein VCRA2117O39_30088 [Vibrio crassostreae]
MGTGRLGYTWSLLSSAEFASVGDKAGFIALANLDINLPLPR